MAFMSHILNLVKNFEGTFAFMFIFVLILFVSKPFKIRQKGDQLDQSHCIKMCFRILTFRVLFQVLQDRSSIRLYKFKHRSQRILIQFHRLLKLVLMELQDYDGKFFEKS